MKSFEEWTAELSAPTWEKFEEEGRGLLKDSGAFMITCRGCDRDFNIAEFIGPDEFDPDVSETFYCGGSERCIP